MDTDKLLNHINIVSYDCFLLHIFFFIFTSHRSRNFVYIPYNHKTLIFFQVSPKLQPHIVPVVMWNIVVEHSIWFLYKCAYPVKKVSVRALHRVPNMKRSNPKRKREKKGDFFYREQKRRGL